VKGESSGSRQSLIAVNLDCDRDAIGFVVHQEGTGFCHRGTRSCFGDRFTLGELERVTASRLAEGDVASGTVRLATEPGLLSAKLLEEAAELGGAELIDEVVHEAADVLYVVMTKLACAGVTLADVERELGRRRLRVSRRPMQAKP
jgi:phosphoribosyl-ATP pyrophosphohydrolase/phosphoribosyl-AMP cyclohydrolase/histidinol dehydrogenase